MSQITRLTGSRSLPATRPPEQVRTALQQWARDLGAALGVVLLEWMIATLACAALVVAVEISVALLQPPLGSGPAMCVTASWMGLVVSMVAARWPGREAPPEEP